LVIGLRMKLLRLPRSKVRLGIALPWNVRDENCVLLLSKGHLVIDEQQLEALLLRGAFVDEEEVRASVAAEAAGKLLISSGDPRKSVANAVSVFGLWDQTTEELKALLADIGSDPDFPARLDVFALHLVAVFDLNPDIAIYRSVRQDNAQNYYYGYSHAVNTAMLCILVARHMAWPAPSVMSLVKAALTMNVAVFELQGQMAAQDYPMRDKQRAALRLHPTQAVEMLQKSGVTDVDWLNAVAQHHERADGTGYPSGRTDITELAAALRVADVFMAKISPRTLRAPVSPKEAVTQLYKDDHGGPLSTALIKEFGIYPPGDFVKLASGELGIVVQRTANARAPIVASITDTSGHPVAKTVRHDSGMAEFAIVESVSDKTMLKRLAPERLYGFAAAPPV
jgi:HD-GYP domain-containing protein (c-di-GMP phosphodiesterase class II)